MTPYRALPSRASGPSWRVISRWCCDGEVRAVVLLSTQRGWWAMLYAFLYVVTHEWAVVDVQQRKAGAA